MWIHLRSAISPSKPSLVNPICLPKKNCANPFMHVKAESLGAIYRASPFSPCQSFQREACAGLSSGDAGWLWAPNLQQSHNVDTIWREAVALSIPGSFFPQRSFPSTFCQLRVSTFPSPEARFSSTWLENYGTFWQGGVSFPRFLGGNDTHNANNVDCSNNPQVFHKCMLS